MEQYMKATATPFVHHALKDTILKIMESKQSCEVKTCSPLIPLICGARFSIKHSYLMMENIMVSWLLLGYNGCLETVCGSWRVHTP